MKQIIIGRTGNQPFPIPDEYVSRKHAIFLYDETTGSMTLEDRSSGGTYIRMGNAYQQINRCQVNAQTEVRLGPRYSFRIGQLFMKPQTTNEIPVKPSKQERKKTDISHLRKVADSYEARKLRLDQKLANIESLKSMSLVPTILGGAFTGVLPSLLGQDFRENWYLVIIGPVIAMTLLVVLQVYCGKAKKDIIAKKSQNDKYYKITFCCPVCHRPFAGHVYENVLAEGKCPKCKTEFYDSKL